jgi:hypothetical protein
MPSASVELTGLEAVKYIASKYDWNVYCPDYNMLHLSAYKQRIVDGYTQCNTDSWLTYEVPMAVINSDEIALLLESDDWVGLGWYEHDSWVGEDEVVTKLWTRSPRFQIWFDTNIHDYVVR